MGTIYVFFADGFEEIEAITPVDVLRRAGLNVETVSVTDEEVVTGAHNIPVICDSCFQDCDFSDADLLLLPGGMPGAATLSEHEGLNRLLPGHVKEGKPVAAICAAPMVLGKLGLLKGKRVTCYPGFEPIWKAPNVQGRKSKETVSSSPEKGRVRLWILHSPLPGCCRVQPKWPEEAMCVKR